MYNEGIKVIEQYSKTLPLTPGIYQMLNAKEEILYIGKAKNLKRRVYSYTQAKKLPNRLQRMVAETKSMQFVSTHTEVEALLLESNLIHNLQPKYNILLRDEKKSYYLLISNHAFPRLLKYRGKPNNNVLSKKGNFFGPFASARVIDEFITSLQKAFLLRACEDSSFNNRKRPCLQYYIKRCSGPCVDYIPQTDYQNLVKQALTFIKGKNNSVQEQIAKEMEKASEALEYEKAAFHRDRLKSLAQVQSHQKININELDDADVIAIAEKAGKTCIQVFIFRNGKHLGHKTYYPKHSLEDSYSSVLTAFLTQFYTEQLPPPIILLNKECEELELVTEALSQLASYKVSLSIPMKGNKKEIVDYAEVNAYDALQRYYELTQSNELLLNQLAEVFELPFPPQRIEVYDNSHTQGNNAYGGLIVAGVEGFVKSGYRTFKFSQIEAGGGDDYNMMRQVITRRFSKVKEGQKQTVIPDLLIIDGGIGQLNAVMQSLNELNLSQIPVIAISKGIARNSGNETFWVIDKPPIKLDKHPELLYYMQRLRDEAHRFCIKAHRNKNLKQIKNSKLFDIPLVGSKRRKALLEYFGSFDNIRNAGIKDLKMVPGVSENIAKKIYEFFH